MIIQYEKLAEALTKLNHLFVEQVEYGKQTAIIKGEQDYFSLGQFLNDLARTQRGVHGTAVGLRVVADSSKHNVINGMVRYLKNRVEVEKAVTNSSTKIDETKLVRDENNTIKISETLYSLFHVKAASSHTDDYISLLKEKLYAGVVCKGSDCGWDFFLDENDKDIELLPTAFAIMALGVHGFKVTDQINYLRNKLYDVNLYDPAIFSEAIFGLYALLVGSNDVETNGKIYDGILKKIWESPYRMMDNLIEQNIEYWFETQHDYVRVPWQVYLLSITSKISDRRFYSVSSQKLLNNMIDLVLTSSFKYQYSGHYISSRTNGILYDSLVQIKNNIKGNLWHKLLFGIDVLRSFLGGKLIRIVLIASGLIVLIISIASWVEEYKNGQKGFADIAPEFIGAIVLSLIALSKKR